MITYPRIHHPDHPEMFVQVILASRPTTTALPLITMHWRYPRIIHSEVMTHRVFSRNARSSRAVPVRTMLEEVRTKPFVPWHWGKNQKGMQAGEECNALLELGTEMADTGIGEMPVPTYLTREEAWLRQRDHAADTAEAYMDAGYHKQIPNRLLEPFSYIDTLITSTQWANFLHLRDHEDAEPHFMDLAGLVRQAINWIWSQDAFQKLDRGQWHMPYIVDDDWEIARQRVRKDHGGFAPHGFVTDLLVRVSAARCARISYAPFDGDASYDRELERFNLLVSSDRVHASPLEHQAMPDTQSHYERLLIEGDDEELLESGLDWDHPELAGNRGPGWIQFRKTLPGEYVAD